MSSDISFRNLPLFSWVILLCAKPNAKILLGMFQAAFSEWYEKYSDAFAAGVWLQHDPGPFLGRVIINKLQERLHKDVHDLGPSNCFGVGIIWEGKCISLS